MEELPKVTSGFRVTRWTFPGSAVPSVWSGVLTHAEEAAMEATRGAIGIDEANSWLPFRDAMTSRKPWPGTSSAAADRVTTGAGRL
jgi:hypothetical protein